MTLIFLKKLLDNIGQSPLKKTLVFYEDGQLHIVDEHGVEPLSLVDEELFAIETISSRAQFLMNKLPERPSNSAMHPDVDERNSESVVNMGLYNKQRYIFYSDDE